MSIFGAASAAGLGAGVRGASHERVRPAERQNGDRPDDNQLPIHEITALRALTR